MAPCAVSTDIQHFALVDHLPQPQPKPTQLKIVRVLSLMIFMKSTYPRHQYFASINGLPVSSQTTPSSTNHLHFISPQCDGRKQIFPITLLLNVYPCLHDCNSCSFNPYRLREMYLPGVVSQEKHIGFLHSWYCTVSGPFSARITLPCLTFTFTLTLIYCSAFRLHIIPRPASLYLYLSIYLYLASFSAGVIPASMSISVMPIRIYTFSVLS